MGVCSLAAQRDAVETLDFGTGRIEPIHHLPNKTSQAVQTTGKLYRVLVG